MYQLIQVGGTFDVESSPAYRNDWLRAIHQVHNEVANERKPDA